MVVGGGILATRIFWNSSNTGSISATPAVVQQKSVFLSSLNALLITIVSQDQSNVGILF